MLFQCSQIYLITCKCKPPALPGGSPRFDLYDGLREFLNSTKRKEIHNERLPESESYEMGLQISHGVYSEDAKEAYFWGSTSAFGRDVWARGYFVSTVGLDENMVRAYIRNQEEEDERYDQMKLPME